MEECCSTGIDSPGTGLGGQGASGGRTGVGRGPGVPERTVVGTVPLSPQSKESLCRRGLSTLRRGWRHSVGEVGRGTPQVRKCLRPTFLFIINMVGGRSVGCGSRRSRGVSGRDRQVRETCTRPVTPDAGQVWTSHSSCNRVLGEPVPRRGPNESITRTGSPVGPDVRDGVSDPDPVGTENECPVRRGRSGVEECFLLFLVLH